MGSSDPETSPEMLDIFRGTSGDDVINTRVPTDANTSGQFDEVRTGQDNDEIALDGSVNDLFAQGGNDTISISGSALGFSQFAMGSGGGDDLGRDCAGRR